MNLRIPYQVFHVVSQSNWLVYLGRGVMWTILVEPITLAFLATSAVSFGHLGTWELRIEIFSVKRELWTARVTTWLRFYYRFLPLLFQRNSKLFRVWRVREFFLPFYSQITSPLPQTNASEVFLRSHSRANEVLRFKSVKYPSFFSIQPFELTMTQKTISSKLAKVHRIKTPLLSLVLCLHCPSSNRTTALHRRHFC